MQSFSFKFHFFHKKVQIQRIKKRRVDFLLNSLSLSSLSSLSSPLSPTRNKIMPLLIVQKTIDGLLTSLFLWRAYPLLYPTDPSPIEAKSSLRNRAIWAENIGLNGGLFWGGMYVVEYLMFPNLRSLNDIPALATFVYYVLWLIPLWCLCIVTNGNLVSEIATHSFKLLKRQSDRDKRVARRSASGSVFNTVARKTGDILYDSFVVYTLFGLVGAVDLIVSSLPWLCQRLGDLCALAGSAPLENLFRTTLADWLPAAGMVVSFVHYCWLYSFWAFNPRWKLEGLTVVQRLKKIECDWAFYFGFGVPLALLTTWNPFFVNIAIYALGFPLLVMLATAATTSLDSTPMKESIIPHIPIFRLSHGVFNLLLSCCKIKKKKN